MQPSLSAASAAEHVASSWQTQIAGGKKGKVWKRIGQYYPNPVCDHITKDFIELEDLEEEAEKGTDKEEIIKQLTAEFVKNHE